MTTAQCVYRVKWQCIRHAVFYKQVTGSTPANTHSQVRDDTTSCCAFCVEQTLEKESGTAKLKLNGQR